MYTVIFISDGVVNILVLLQMLTPHQALIVLYSASRKYSQQFAFSTFYVTVSFQNGFN